MTQLPTREQFIGKLRSLEMTLSARTNPFNVGEPHQSRGVVHWTVNGFILVSDVERALWGARSLGLHGRLEREDDGWSRRWVFWMKGMTIDLDVVRNAWDVLDARDIDSSHLTPLIDFDTGQVRAEVSEYDGDAEYASSLVVIDRAQVAEGWRGKGGLGRLMVRKAIDLVAPACTDLVALEAHPYTEETGGRTAPAETVAAIERTWESMGFSRFADSKLFIQSTARVSPYDDTEMHFNRR